MVNSFDVARLAGVSQPTVSRALRNLPGTSPATRERVLKAAQELSYITSDRGRSLSRRSTQRVAVVSEELTNPYYPELVEPLRRHLAACGYRTVLVTDSADDAVGLDALVDGSYDGIVLTTTMRRSTLPRDLTERGVPHVLVNRLLDEPESPSCGIDNRSGANAVVRLLADLGHREVGVIQGPVTTSTGKERAEALAEGMREHGIAVRRDHARRVRYRHDDGMEAAMDLLDRDRRPTALICGNDVIAFGALSAARRLGVRVPEDLTIVGFDDIPMAGWPLVNLTTVACDLRELARRSVALLLEQMTDPGRTVEEHRIAPTLVLRGTHGPPAASSEGPTGR